MKVIFLVFVSFFSFAEKELDNSSKADRTVNSGSAKVFNKDGNLLLKEYPGLANLLDKPDKYTEEEDSKEVKADDVQAEETKEEKNELPDSFYILTLIIIVVLAYFLNKRKPLMNP